MDTVKGASLAKEVDKYRRVILHEYCCAAASVALDRALLSE
jgi:hypothetical protein